MPASTSSTKARLIAAWRTEMNSRLSSMLTSAPHQHVAVDPDAVAQLDRRLLRLGERHEAPVIHLHGYVVKAALADDLGDDSAVRAGLRDRRRRIALGQGSAHGGGADQG